MKQTVDLQAVYREKNKFEDEARLQGFQAVAGVDEAGRGPVAGPIYAAAVILQPNQPILGLNDSKQLTEKKREALFDLICAQARSWAIASISAVEIDEIGIQEANYEVMKRALCGLTVKPDFVLIDHVKLGLDTPSLSMAKGDFLSNSIAAASILAKVARDREMHSLDLLYPGYGLAKHKGYGTRAHKEAIGRLGLSPVHRRSFLQKWIHDLGL